MSQMVLEKSNVNLELSNFKVLLIDWLTKQPRFILASVDKTKQKGLEDSHSDVGYPTISPGASVEISHFLYTNYRTAFMKERN